MEIPIDQEIWRATTNFPNYQISSHGRVRNNKGRILKTRIDRGGYEYLILWNDGKRKGFNIHKLVAQEFIPNPINLPIVDHISRNKLDNSVQNLRWVTQSINLRNQSLSIKNTTGCKGISFIKKRQAYLAQVRDLDGNVLSKTFFLSHDLESKQKAEEWRHQKELDFGYL